MNMILKNYRLSKSREEILKVLLQKFQDQCEFIIWQKTEQNNERDFVIEASFKEINLDDGVFTVSMQELDQLKINQQKEIYFLLKGQDFAFKTKLSIAQPRSKSLVSFQAPKEVSLVELRNHPRIYFNDTEFKNVNVKFAAKEVNENEITSSCRIFNISKSGICIIVTKETLSEIDFKKEIILEGLSFFEELGNIKKAAVRNARVFAKKTLKSDELYAIGLEFT